MLRRVAAFLRDLPAAWEVATPEERNVLARTIFQSVEIAGDLLTAIVPQPEFAPFFNLLDSSREPSENDEGQPVAAPNRQDSALAGGSDGDRIRVLELPAISEGGISSSDRSPRSRTQTAGLDARLTAGRRGTGEIMADTEGLSGRPRKRVATDSLHADRAGSGASNVNGTPVGQL